MLLAVCGEFQARAFLGWRLSETLGTIISISHNGKEIHAGSIGYARMKWKKLTGEILPN